jgi:hypothetical protein
LEEEEEEEEEDRAPAFVEAASCGQHERGV